ncbi:MAG: hypothetical protein ACLRZG_05790 [Streptococcus sp.]
MACSLWISPDKDFPPTQGLWSLQELNTNSDTNPLYRLQILLFRLLPKHVFEKQDASQTTDASNLDRIKKDSNLTDTAKSLPLFLAW